MLPVLEGWHHSNTMFNRSVIETASSSFLITFNASSREDFSLVTDIQLAAADILDISQGLRELLRKLTA